MPALRPHPRHGAFLPSLPSNFPRRPPSLFHFEATPPLFSPIRVTRAPSSSTRHSPMRSRHGTRRQCSAEGGDAAGPGDSLKGFVGEQVEALLKKEENRALLDGLEDASRRVEAARRALADIERQEAEAARAKEYVLQLESRRSEIAESQREIMEARTMMEEAERSLSSNVDNNPFGAAVKTSEPKEINKEEERLESIKAALISSIVGTLAALPISFYQETSGRQLVAHLAVIFITCALFGVTFRYTVRRDLDNIQLKTGTCAAFGFVRGFSAAETSKPLEFDNVGFMSLAIDGTAHVLESTFIFIFSAVALDYCFKMGLLRPFPIKE